MNKEFETVKNGGRISNKFSLHDEEKQNMCGYVHNWRTIVCDGETDIVECSKCGRQKLSKCNFDEEYA